MGADRRAGSTRPAPCSTSRRHVSISSRSCVTKTSGLVDDEMSARVSLVAPHVRRAAAIGKTAEVGRSRGRDLRRHPRRPQARACSWSMRTAASFTPTRGPGAARRSGFPLFDARRGWWRANAAIDRTLHALFAAAAKGDAAIGTGGIAVPLLSRDGEHYVAHALPLTAGAGRRAGDRQPRRRGAVRAEGGDRPSLPAREHRATLRADADRTPGSPLHRRRRRRSRSGRRPRHRSRHGEDASRPALPEDRNPAAGRPGQARGGISSPLLG